MGNIRFVITTMRDQHGLMYAQEARDEASGTLLATAKKIAMEGPLVVVEEIQYSSTGAVVYRGKLFLPPMGKGVIREERIEGKKNWDIFDSWQIWPG